MLRSALIVSLLIVSASSAFAFTAAGVKDKLIEKKDNIIEIKDKLPWSSFKNEDEKQSEYMLNIQKEEAKDRYIKKKLDRDPSGYMTVEEYELLSVPKDKRLEDIPIPKPDKPYDMQYVPEPTYEIVRYNNPPGSPEISLGNSIKVRRQQNAQGIVAPDYSILVYPSVYYYPKNGVVACDLFVIPLETRGNLVARIQKANTMHRDPDPILSTEKSLDNFGIFRTLTPVDFSSDGRKLLVKEKVGSNTDGIWQTYAIVYDFDKNTSYKLNELRDAIVYYWTEYKNLPLNNYRWDIFPLGFDVEEPDRIIAAAYAYTGEIPVFLGNWSIDSLGERAKLVSLKPNSVQVSMNGFKMVQSGVVPKMITDIEQKQLEHEARVDKDAQRSAEKEELKQLKKEYKDEIKALEKQHKQNVKDINELKEKVTGTTTENDAVQLKEDWTEIQELRQELRDLKESEKQEKKETESIIKRIRKEGVSTSAP